jgi:hypothetical protein
VAIHPNYLVPRLDAKAVDSAVDPAESPDWLSIKDLVQVTRCPLKSPEGVNLVLTIVG